MAQVGWLAVAAAAGAAALWWPAAPRFPGAVDRPAARSRPDAGPFRRSRWLWSGSAGLSGLTWLSGWDGAALGAGLAALVWWWIGRSEPAGVRRARARARAELPHLVLLLGAALRAGAAPATATTAVCRAMPGPAADRFGAASAQLALGGDPATVWATLATDPELAPLGRCLARAHATGAPIAEAVARLGQELASDRRSAVQHRARVVGVRAALPLGLCLLPAFLLLGIVPVVAGLLTGLLLG